MKIAVTFPRALAAAAKLLAGGLCLVALLLMSAPARANVAPPGPPPGSAIGPGTEITQVQMLQEKVVLKVYTRQANKPELAGDVAGARVSASFSMRNQGSAAEKLAVHFPLARPDGAGDGTPAGFIEIQDLTVKVNQKLVIAKRLTTPNPLGPKSPPIPWAVFDVTFPPGKDVSIDLTYTTRPQGYLPYGTFHYLLDAGAGWKGPIGAVDLTVQMPYAADEENIVSDDQLGLGSTPGGKITGTEIRWHFENLEPTPADNFQISLVLPLYWQNILLARKTAAATPKNGGTWGALARACKFALLAKGGLRHDAGSQKLYAEAVGAYEKALALQPKVAQWHVGYAELLWPAYNYSEARDPALMVRAAQELKATLGLEPENAQALALMDEISWAMPGVIRMSSAGYTFLVLTATPTAFTTPAPTALPVTPTASPQPTATSTASPLPTQTAEPMTPAPATKAGGGLCGAAALAPLLVVGLMRRRRQ